LSEAKESGDLPARKDLKNPDRTIQRASLTIAGIRLWAGPLSVRKVHG
jgi:hypothetical protein